jgi:hypothetical protein
MSCANDTIHLLVASDISTFKFEIGRADWSSVRTQEIQLYSKFGVITDCSLVVLFKSFTGSADLDKVRKILCRVVDIFLHSKRPPR